MKEEDPTKKPNSCDSSENESEANSGKEEEEEDTNPNGRPVIEVTDYSHMRSQLAYAIANVRNRKEILLQAFGTTIPKAIRMADIVKLRCDGVH